MSKQSLRTQTAAIRKQLWLSPSLFLDRHPIPPEVIFLSTALVVGLGTGVGAVVFRYLIHLFSWVGFVWIPSVTEAWGKSYVVFVPTIGGLIVGLLIYYFAREAKGHGVPEVMESVALRGGRIRPIVAVIKSLASSICIGSGGSVGREGPIVQIGSAIGSTVGQWLKLSDARVSNLVACGAAGGIAATFNAPIAGVMFGMEIILGGRFGVPYFSSVVISAVAASAVGRAAFGDAPAFAIPFQYGIKSLWEFSFYPILGILSALVAVAFVRGLYGFEDWFDQWQKVPEWFKPAVGGAILGLVALLYPLVTHVTWSQTPQIYNVGYTVIEDVLTHGVTLQFALALLLLKLLATSLTLGSGGSGGIFAPALFMGAMLGAAFALLLNHLPLGFSVLPGAYALVGMAAVFAASAHAPVTAVIILFELTGDYRVILPLLLTVAVATLLAKHLLHDESIYTLKLTRRGVRLHQGRDVDVLEAVFVGEVMDMTPPTVTGTMTLSDFRTYLFQSHHHGVAVLDDKGTLVGVASLQDLERAMQQPGWENLPVSQIMSENMLTVTPDQSIGTALKLLAQRDIGRIPVVDKAVPPHLLGLIRRTSIARAYQLGILRREDLQDRASQIRSRQSAGDTEFVELIVQPGSQVAGQLVRDLQLPEECLLTTRRHRDHRHILHGDDRLEVGDTIIALCAPDHIYEVRKVFQ
ncbi:MAG: CBS domain-containing protein [Chloroflexi bacterium]|nr:CBS domain-containing protein [Chloroflexota bacterium]